MPATPTPFRSILVPLDGSALAEQALPLAASLARRTGGKLRLVLVHQLPPAPLDPAAASVFVSVETATRKSQRNYLRDVQARLRAQGIRLSSAVTLTGAVGPALVQHVQELGIDLVVMATHGRGGVRRAWLGSVADHLIRTLPVPVLIVRAREGEGEGEGAVGADGVPGPGLILVPLDGSTLAEQALDPAAALARLWDRELVVMQVVPPVQLMFDGAVPFPTGYDDELTAMLRTQAQDYVDDVVERLRTEGVRASGAAITGWSAVDAILEEARPERVAAIVLATHGRGGLRRLALGSVADKLVRAGEVPVMVCRPVGRAKARTPGARARARGG